TISCRVALQPIMPGRAGSSPRRCPGTPELDRKSTGMAAHPSRLVPARPSRRYVRSSIVSWWDHGPGRRHWSCRGRGRAGGLGPPCRFPRRSQGGEDRGDPGLDGQVALLVEGRGEPRLLSGGDQRLELADAVHEETGHLATEGRRPGGVEDHRGQAAL